MNARTPTLPANILPDTVEVCDGVLCIGGYPLPDLAERFGTPLYVYDELTLRAQARRVRAAFGSAPSRVSFAAKACATVGVLRIFHEEGLDLETVSVGEIEAGLRAGFAPAHMHLHGNAKTDEELHRAIELGLGAIVVDNLDELHRLTALAPHRGASVNLALRINLTALNVHTHPYLRTSGPGTKFGFSPDSIDAAFEHLASARHLRLNGLHTHPGSQIADASVYGEALVTLHVVAERARAYGLTVEEMSIGGGWAVPYCPGDAALTPESIAETLLPILPEGVTLAVEPGRALVARAGTALYRVVTVKRSSVGNLIAVDGGMGDNPRPALYGARYFAMPVRDPLVAGDGDDRLVGRYCEEGDVLATGVHLPVVPGDLIVMPVAGAYQLSMASAYNLVPPPAVVLVGAGEAQFIVRRGTVADLLAREL